VDTRAYAPDLDQVAMQAHEIQELITVQVNLEW